MQAVAVPTPRGQGVHPDGTGSLPHTIAEGGKTTKTYCRKNWGKLRKTKEKLKKLNDFLGFSCFSLFSLSLHCKERIAEGGKPRKN